MNSKCSREGSTPIRILKFFLTRNIGTLVDTAVLWLFADLVFKGSYVGENIVSPTISFEVATLVNYITSYYWIYNSRIEQRSVRQFFRRFLTFNLSSVLGFLIKMAFLLLFKRWLGWHVVLCNLLALSVSGIFNFLFVDHWVFRRKTIRPARELLSREELGNMSPIFSGRYGQILAALLLKLFGVAKVNQIYDRAADDEGAAFAANFLDELGSDYQVGNAERLDHLPEGAFITISNHPYGALDGVIIIHLIGSRRPDFKVMANDFLSRAKSLASSFITVNPTGEEKQAITATNLSGIRGVLRHLHEGHPMGFFPSGAVSDYHPRQRDISDREWQESLIRVIRKAQVPVIPVRFFDGNSKFFYALGLISWKIRVLRLPREVLWQKGRMQRVGIGETISVEEINRFDTVEGLRDFLRSSVYDMPLPDHFSPRYTPQFSEERITV
jgi:putative hemolysin/putative flippase GtrA